MVLHVRRDLAELDPHRRVPLVPSHRLEGAPAAALQHLPQGADVLEAVVAGSAVSELVGHQLDAQERRALGDGVVPLAVRHREEQLLGRRLRELLPDRVHPLQGLRVEEQAVVHHAGLGWDSQLLRRDQHAPVPRDGAGRRQEDHRRQEALAARDEDVADGYPHTERERAPADARALPPPALQRARRPQQHTRLPRLRHHMHHSSEEPFPHVSLLSAKVEVRHVHAKGVVELGGRVQWDLVELAPLDEGLHGLLVLPPDRRRDGLVLQQGGQVRVRVQGSL
eukprot:16452371-Heterocapsa_arctica.AAC.1